MDGFDQHFQVTVPFPLTSAFNFSSIDNFSSENVLAKLGIEPWAGGSEESMLPMCYAAPLMESKFVDNRLLLSSYKIQSRFVAYE